jgi:hypothetical protein
LPCGPFSDSKIAGYSQPSRETLCELAIET